MRQLALKHLGNMIRNRSAPMKVVGHGVSALSALTISEASTLIDELKRKQPVSN